MSDSLVEAELVMPQVDFHDDPLPDLPERLKEIEASGKSVARVRYNGGEAWLLVSYDNVAWVFRNEGEVPASRYYQEQCSTMGHTILQMDGKEHRAHKAALSPWFAPSRVKTLEHSTILPVIDQLIDEFGDRRAVMLDVDFCRRLSFNVISRLVGLDVPPEAEGEIQDMISDLNQMADESATEDVRKANARAAVERTNVLLGPLLEQRKAKRKDDFVSYLLDLEVEGRKLTDEEILDNTRFVYFGGADSTSWTLGNIVEAILSRPDLLETMLADRSSRRPIIDELIRLEGVSGLFTRRNYKDIVIDGVLIPEGAMILLAIPNANRDPKRFPNPTEVKPERSNHDQSLMFGAGTHHCLGKHLAKLELQLAVDRLLDRLPGLRLDGPAARPQGSQFRFITNGLPVRFDDVLPAPAPPA